MCRSSRFYGGALLLTPTLCELTIRIAVAGGTLLALDNPVRRSFVNEMVPTDEIPNGVTLSACIA